MSQENSPFKFLDSYQQADADVFFGREEETRKLYGALSGVKHLMVYGPSGSGKTSLVECGLRNQFSDADWYAITIRKGADINASVFASINNALKEKIETDPVTKKPMDPAMEFGQAIKKLFDERYQMIYLLFDQFEELLISGEDAEKKFFFTLLNKLIRNKVPCRILLIMREEFIGHLSEFEPLCPSIFQYRFRVEKMGRKFVEDVIYKILEAPRYQTNFTVVDSHKLAESILSKLPDKRKEIELAHVQVFLGELWDRAQTTKKNIELPVLSTDLIRDDDNLEGVLERFLKNQIKDLEGSYGEGVPLELLAGMISERNTKLPLSEAAIIGFLDRIKVVSKKPIADLLKELEQRRRILRALKVGDETQYEISHDVLALVVGQNRTEKMKMREDAERTYNVYLKEKELLSQIQIETLQSYDKILHYPPDLQAKIDDSIKEIKKQQQQDKARARKRKLLYYSLVVLGIIILLYRGYVWQDGRYQKQIELGDDLFKKNKFSEAKGKYEAALSYVHWHFSNKKDAESKKTECDRRKNLMDPYMRQISAGDLLFNLGVSNYKSAFIMYDSAKNTGFNPDIDSLVIRPKTDEAIKKYIELAAIEHKAGHINLAIRLVKEALELDPLDKKADSLLKVYQ